MKIVICLLTKKFKADNKMSTFQLNFFNEVYVIFLMMLILEKCLYNEICIIVLLRIGESLATKCVSLNDEPCINRPTLFNLSPIELNYYGFMVNLD